MERQHCLGKLRKREFLEGTDGDNSQKEQRGQSKTVKNPSDLAIGILATFASAG